MAKTWYLIGSLCIFEIMKEEDISFELPVLTFA